MLPWETLWCCTQHDRIARHSTTRSGAKTTRVLTAPPEVHARPCGRAQAAMERSSMQDGDGLPPARGVGLPVFEAVPFVPIVPKPRSTPCLREVFGTFGTRSRALACVPSLSGEPVVDQIHATGGKSEGSRVRSASFQERP
jgi:hypothetical protein